MAVRHDADPNALIAAKRREAAKPGRRKAAGRGSGLTPSIKTAIELLVFGKEGDPGKILKMEDAAEHAGISPRALRTALLKPSVEAFYQQQLAALRNGERAASIRAIAAIRDDAGLKATAAGQNVRLKAADTLAFDKPGTQVQINTQVNVAGEIVTPGYAISLTRRDRSHDQVAREAVKTIDADPVRPAETTVYTNR